MFNLCAIGNALVDVLISTDESFLRKNDIAKGAMILIDEKQAAALYEKAGPAAKLSSGGSAANSTTGAASLGIACAFMGKVGNDSFGEIFAKDMQAQSVHFATKPSPDLATGRCLIFVTPDAQRTMCACLGSAGEFAPGDIDPKVIQDSDITYLEGYLFDRPSAQQAFEKAARVAHEAGRKIAMTLSDVSCAERHRDNFKNLIRSGVDILFSNEGEIKELYQTNDLQSALAAAKANADIVVATRGEKGAVIASGDQTYETAAQKIAKVVDTTGAGDLFAAGFLYGLSQNKSLPECGRIGAIAAGEIISHFGAKPQTSLKDLI